MLHEQIKKDVTDAMKSKDMPALRAARNLLAALTNELVAKKQKPSEILDDDSALAVIRRLAKQRKDSIEQFRAGEREDLVAKEEEELGYLDKYLPKMMPIDEIKKIVETKKEELGITDKSGIGRLMGAVMTELKGQANGKEVKEVLEKLFD